MSIFSDVQAYEKQLEVTRAEHERVRFLLAQPTPSPIRSVKWLWLAVLVVLGFELLLTWGAVDGARERLAERERAEEVAKLERACLDGQTWKCSELAVHADPFRGREALNLRACLLFDADACVQFHRGVTLVSVAKGGLNQLLSDIYRDATMDGGEPIVP